KARRRLAWLAFWLPASVAGVLAATVVAGSIAEERGLLPIAKLGQDFDGLLDWSGLGLRQVSVAGHRHTSDAAIYAALALETARNVVAYDIRGAQARLEALPWVQKASIVRVPDGLEVRIVERQPIAVWQLGNRYAVIDASGRPITTVAPGAMPGLPRVVGEGAERGAQALLDKLAQYPDLATRVQWAERRGTGRWTLQLKQGFSVHLPLENEGEAIARAAVLVASGLAEKGDIDLREGAKMPARLKRAAGGVPASSAAPRAAGRT
ncbi:MAG: FtsQ-type POTRA domain-containing protein, partial [Hyphomicrobiales bacterium]